MIEIGDQVPNLAITIYDVNGGLSNGGAVTCTVTPDGGAGIPVTVTNVSLGVYTAAYTATVAGFHAVTWTVTGANFGVHNDSFSVEVPAFSIVSLQEVKNWLSISRTADDETLRMLSVTASDICESVEGTGRIWRRQTFIETFDGGKYTIQLKNTPVTSVTSVMYDGSTLDSSQYDIQASAGILYNFSGWFPYSGHRRNTTVIYVAGGGKIPSPVRYGVLELVRHLYAIHKGGKNLPSQGEYEYSPGYLIPNRVALAWRGFQGANLG